MKPFPAKKCLRCPYWLGKIECFKNPCLQCLASGSKESPFADWKPKYK